MTIKCYNWIVPINKVSQFHEILCATGGRYLYSNLFRFDKHENVYRVDFIEGEHTCLKFERCLQDVKEKNSTQKYKYIFRRMLNYIRKVFRK